MGSCCKLISLSLLVAAIAIGYQSYKCLTKTIEVPKLDLDEYWGPGDKSQYKENKEIIQQKNIYSDANIKNLQKKLNESWAYQAPLEDVGFEYGFNTNKLKEVVKYWRDDYLPRWTERQSYLWSLPQYTTDIQGLRMHFIHTKVDEKTKKAKKVFPLLLIHGWPGSVREFYDIIPMLSDKNQDIVFEVVAPSLPGYGWSQPASKKGLGPAKMAVILRNLMVRLGYNEFYVQGGDWGSLIGSDVATLFPKNVIAYHSNICITTTNLAMLKSFIASFYPSQFIAKEHQDFYYPMKNKFFDLLEESGYMHIQSTKPDTIGTALTNNPIGLAAYILEKFSTWTNPGYRQLKDGGLEKDIPLDTLLDNVMIYYLTNSITSSQRLYAESISEMMKFDMSYAPIGTPTGCARFKHDVMHSFDWQLQEKYTNLIHSTYHQTGGHFIAMELPKVLYQDFINFVEKVLAVKKKKATENQKKTKSAL